MRKNNIGFRHIGITPVVENYSGIAVLPREFPMYEAWVNSRGYAPLQIMFGVGYMLRTGLVQKEINKLALTIHRITATFG